MKQIVGTAAVAANIKSTDSPVIQNLGPGNLYFDFDAAVSASTGFKLEVGMVYEFPRDLSLAGPKLYFIADAANTDVRMLVVG